MLIPRNGPRREEYCPLHPAIVAKFAHPSDSSSQLGKHGHVIQITKESYRAASHFGCAM
jgi:hypothetical protein